MDTAGIFQLDRTAVDSVQKYVKTRFVMKELAETYGRPFVLLQGPRGVGKTVLLRQYRSQLKHAVYISADTLEQGQSLYEVVDHLRTAFSIHTFFIDEIQYLDNPAGELKKIFDFTDISMYCTSSSALRIQDSAYDLSRRIVTLKVPPCSFREYIYFIHSQELPKLSIEDLVSGNVHHQYLSFASDFERYLQGGGYLFLLQQGTGREQFRNILSTICTRDIPLVKKNLTIEELGKLEQVIAFIGKSPIEGISYSSVSRNVGITKYKAEQYISLLEIAFLVYRNFPGGTNVLKEPKVFMELPYRLLYRSYQECLGSLREDFFASAMQQAHISFTYLKSIRGEKTPDFLMNHNGTPIVFEVGGKGKGRTQFKNIACDKKIICYHSTADVQVSKDRIPLSLLGFL